MSAPLQRAIRFSTGQNLHTCQGCGDCDLPVTHTAQDIPVSSVVQMILMDDEEVLTAQTVWADEVLAHVPLLCRKGIALRSVLLALRAEAKLRGIKNPL